MLNYCLIFWFPAILLATLISFIAFFSLISMLMLLVLVICCSIWCRWVGQGALRDSPSVV